MEFFYLIGLQQVETGMKKQFEASEQTRPEHPATRRERPAVSERARLAIGAALDGLANAIDPATPVSSQQH